MPRGYCDPGAYINRKKSLYHSASTSNGRRLQQRPCASGLLEATITAGFVENPDIIRANNDGLQSRYVYCLGFRGDINKNPLTPTICINCGC